ESGPNIAAFAVRRRRERIVNPDELTARIEQSRKISAELLGLRNGIGGAVETGIPDTLVSEHEKQPVFAIEDLWDPDRTLGQKSERIFMPLGNRKPEPVGQP